MRLLFVCTDMRIGGAERHWATLVPALHDRGVDVQVLCLTGEGPLFGELVARGVPATFVNMRRRTDLAGVRRALEYARPRPDAVVSRGVDAQIVGEAIARRAKAAHVVNEHTPLTTRGKLAAPRPHQQLLTRLVARRVDAVICVSERQVPPLAALGYPRDRIEVVPNGVFESEIAGVEPSPELEGDGFTALCVAGLRPEKRVDLFIQAVRDARRSDPLLTGYVAGEGPEQERLARLAEGSGVELLGARLDALELIRAAGLVCLLSETEALPMSILEAMALERPVLACDVGGNAEAVQDGETGYLVAPGDLAGAQRALLTLAQDPGLACEMGLAGRRRQRERFSGEAMVDGYLAAFERLAAPLAPKLPHRPREDGAS
jgi:glycosyltransferase involved in cell wall biosynthesis